MGIEIEELKAYFTADTSQLEAAGKKALSIVDEVEARFKKIKTELKITVDKNSVSKFKSDLSSIKLKTLAVNIKIGKVDKSSLKNLAVPVTATVGNIKFPSSSQNLSLKIKTLTIDASRIVVNGSNLNLPNGQAGGGSGSLMGSVFGGNIASRGLTEAISLTKDLAGELTNLGVEAVKTAADFQNTVNSLAVFTGSTRLAKKELEGIDEASRNTVGLRLQTAEEGYTRLRALGFEAKNAKNLVVGLAKEKVISNASEQDINRVIVNLIQLSSGSARASQDIKEIIHALPSMKSAFIDAFGSADPKKIAAFIDKNPDQAFEKLASAMAKVETPAGGLNNAFDKLLDAFVEIGREAEPLLDPLTDDIKDLTQYLLENKNSWSAWGQSAADAMQGASDLWRGFSKLIPEQENIPGKEYPVRNALRRGLLAAGTGGSSELFGYLVDSGKEERLRKEQQKPLSDDFKLRASRISADNTFDFSAEGQKKLLETKKEMMARETAEQEKAAQARETFVKKELENLKISAVEAETILKNRFDVEQALRDSAFAYTAAQEKNNIAASGQAKTNYLQSEIARVKGFYDKQISLQSGSDDEIAKLESEKTKKLSDLNKELRVNAINTVKEIAAKERQIYEERRQSAIKFKQLQIQETAFGADNKSFDIGLDIDRQAGIATEGFNRLKQIVGQSYEDILQITKQKNALALQNLSLTGDEKNNLIKEQNLEEKKLAEDNRRAILDIEQKQYQQRIAAIQNFYSQKQAFEGQQYQTALNLFDYLMNSEFQVGEFNKILGDSVSAINDFQKLNDAINSADAKISKMGEGFGGNIYKLKDREQELNSKAQSGALSAEETQEKGLLPSKILEANNALDKQRGIWKGLIQDRDMFAAQNLDVWGLDQISGAIKLLNSADFSKLETFTKLKEAGVNGQNDAQRNELLNRFRQNQSVLANTSDTETAKIQALTNDQKQLVLQILDLNIKTDQALKEIRSNSPAGIENYIKDLPNNPKERGNIVYDANTEIWQETKKLVQENTALESEYYKNSIYWAEIRKNTVLDYEKQIYTAEQNRLAKEQITVSQQIRMQAAQAPSYKQIGKDFLAELPNNVANTLTGIAQQWDGTWSGLFDSVKRGFGQMLSDLAAQYAKAAISKLIGQLVGIVVGALGGGLSAGGGGKIFGDGGGFGNFGDGQFIKFGGHYATGGYITGAGTSTSDSIPAMLSNKEYVQNAKAVEYYGVDFMNALNNMKLPRARLASGGLVNTGINIFRPSATTSEDGRLGTNSVSNSNSQTTINNNNTINQTIHAPRGLFPQKSQRQVAEAALSGVSRTTKQ